MSDQVPRKTLIDVDSDDEESYDLYDLVDASALVDAPTPLPAFPPASSSAQHDSFTLEFQNSNSTDIYRCIAEVESGATHRSMADVGESHLDSPFQMGSFSTPSTGFGEVEMDSRAGNKMMYPVEPSPRMYQLRLEHTHMYVACPLVELVKKMDSLLEKHNVDFMFSPEECLWRGMYYSSKEPFASVDFRIYLNAMKNSVGANRYLVEFVRRSGDAMAFNQLFSNMIEKFIADGKVTNDKGEFVSARSELPTPFSSLDIAWENVNPTDMEFESENAVPRPLLCRSTSATTASSNDGTEDFDDDFEFDCTDEELFEPLFAMAKSTFEDVHVQGLGLVSHEIKKGNGERFVKACPGLVDLLIVRLTEAKSDEVRRLAVTSICDLCLIPSVQELLVQGGATVILAQVAASHFVPKTAEMQRQAAQALANLCTNCDYRTAVLAAVQDKIEVFEDLVKLNDERLSKSITDVRSALEAC